MPFTFACQLSGWPLFNSNYKQFTCQSFGQIHCLPRSGVKRFDLELLLPTPSSSKDGPDSLLKCSVVPPPPPQKGNDPLALTIAIKRNDLTTQFRKLQHMFLYAWQYTISTSLQTGRQTDRWTDRQIDRYRVVKNIDISNFPSVSSISYSMMGHKISLQWLSNYLLPILVPTKFRSKDQHDLSFL